jgi:hypothetical protein
MRIKTLLATLAVTTLHAGCGYDGIWDIDFGYRHDNLSWSIAGQEGFPNYFATLDWPDIHSVQIGTRYVLSGWDSIYLRAEGYFGWILQAENTYQVFLNDDHTDLFSQEKACRTGDKVYGAKIGLGAHLLKLHGPFDLAFLAGYSMQGLRLRWRDPKLLYSVTQFPGSVDDLVAKYRPKWNGGFVGLDGSLRWRSCLLVTASYEVHWTTFRSHGVWNWTEPLDQQLIFGNYQYYRQEWKDCGTAWGHVWSGSITYNSSENWYLGLVANAQYFRSRGCDYDVTFFTDNSNPNLIYIVTFPNNTDNLNPVRWISYYVGITLECQF